MSIMEIPDSLYRQLFEEQVASCVRKGLWLDDARRRAAEIMDGAFVARSSALQTDFEKDQQEYVEDMSLGGRPYRVR